MWHSSQFSFSVTSSDTQMVVGILREVETQLEVRVACVYAGFLLQERHVLFDKLSVECASWKGPGLVMGDFNSIRCVAEAFGGNPRSTGLSLMIS